MTLYGKCTAVSSMFGSQSENNFLFVEHLLKLHGMRRRAVPVC